MALFKFKKRLEDEDLIEVEEVEDEDEDEEETTKSKDSAIRLSDSEVALFRAMIRDLAPLAENAERLLALLDAKTCDEDEKEMEDEDMEESLQDEEEAEDEEEETKTKDSFAYFNKSIKKEKIKDEEPEVPIDWNARFKR